MVPPLTKGRLGGVRSAETPGVHTETPGVCFVA